MNRILALISLLYWSASAIAQLAPTPSSLTQEPSRFSQSPPPQESLQVQSAKQRARQAILHPVPARDFAHLKNKELRQMTREELELLPLIDPHRVNQEIDKRKTPAEKEKDRQCLRAVLDPLTMNQEQERTKSREQRQLEADAAQAVLNPRTPSTGDRAPIVPRPH